ncbi:hypothetical protein AYI68_g1087 [Smittium mucronatum]|uniref:Uncharacterized protein n=1 Tax=Smittium mucronatum TaxID=133383 RepID=A0A1R0H6M9_9FUNG|nr:hypothetical protein AYI68_g1087 [Smittium mucronatum]
MVTRLTSFLRMADSGCHWPLLYQMGAFIGRIGEKNVLNKRKKECAGLMIDAMIRCELRPRKCHNTYSKAVGLSANFKCISQPKIQRSAEKQQ